VLKHTSVSVVAHKLDARRLPSSQSPYQSTLTSSGIATTVLGTTYTLCLYSYSIATNHITTSEDLSLHPDRSKRRNPHICNTCLNKQFRLHASPKTAYFGILLDHVLDFLWSLYSIVGGEACLCQGPFTSHLQRSPTVRTPVNTVIVRGGIVIQKAPAQRCLSIPTSASTVLCDCATFCTCCSW
jgi:hypothetical protein